MRILVIGSETFFSEMRILLRNPIWDVVKTEKPYLGISLKGIVGVVMEGCNQQALAILQKRLENDDLPALVFGRRCVSHPKIQDTDPGFTEEVTQIFIKEVTRYLEKIYI